MRRLDRVPGTCATRRGEHRGRDFDHEVWRLDDGELVAEADRPRGEFPLSPEPAEYRLELDDLGLDLLNTAPDPWDHRGPRFIDLQVRHQPRAAGPEIDGARLWVSYDDGASWLPRPVRRAPPTPAQLGCIAT